MVKKAVLSLRPQAIDDIESAFTYLVENAGTDVAQHFFDEIKNQSEALRVHPELGAAIETNLLESHYLIRHKVLNHFNYVMYYRIDETPQLLTIDIIRVLHSAQDRWSILGQEPE